MKITRNIFRIKIRFQLARLALFIMLHQIHQMLINQLIVHNQVQLIAIKLIVVDPWYFSLLHSFLFFFSFTHDDNAIIMCNVFCNQRRM